MDRSRCKNLSARRPLPLLWTPTRRRRRNLPDVLAGGARHFSSTGDVVGTCLLFPCISPTPNRGPLTLDTGNMQGSAKQCMKTVGLSRAEEGFNCGMALRAVAGRPKPRHEKWKPLIDKLQISTSNFFWECSGFYNSQTRDRPIRTPPHLNGPVHAKPSPGSSQGCCCPQPIQ